MNYAIQCFATVGTRALDPDEAAALAARLGAERTMGMFDEALSEGNLDWIVSPAIGRTLRIPPLSRLVPVSLTVFAVMMAAALLHAGWNAMMKTATDKLLATIMVAGAAATLAVVHA